MNLILLPNSSDTTLSIAANHEALFFARHPLAAPIPISYATACTPRRRAAPPTFLSFPPLGSLRSRLLLCVFTFSIVRRSLLPYALPTLLRASHAPPPETSFTTPEPPRLSLPELTPLSSPSISSPSETSFHRFKFLFFFWIKLVHIYIYFDEEIEQMIRLHSIILKLIYYYYSFMC
jgi:hypothetical protein